MTSTIQALLATNEGDARALSADTGVELSFRDVLRTADAIARSLAAAGVRRTDRIALVTRNGPGAALAFLGATLAGVAAPLNPAYRQPEFEFSLRDLPARVLVSDGCSPAASAAARAVGVPELRLGEGFALEGRAAANYLPAAPEDVALVLHTSGTTGNPKRVPLTQSNLTTSAATIARTLELRPGDRCLNVMPLFHIHGLIGCLLSSLNAGSSILCTPGFDAFRMRRWLSESRATWFSAVPTMHQAFLARAGRGEGGEFAHALRFVRSASSSLPGVVKEQLESVLGVPAIEAYGMTEASHQVASNPLPPGARRPGSVGRPTGIEVSVVGAEGSAMPTGERGEVVIRGPSVTAGYEGVDPATFTFPGGWLRTGDQGFSDGDGYLWLTGRLKELINRGGEKVSPREVEEVLLSHLSVAQAVVFAMPHDRLGEDVAAAIVAAPGVEVDTVEVLRFAEERLAGFKVPCRLLVLDEIPLGPTGKPQRVGMAERLGIV
jgi:acyl-CoA synthetase (AMP-forming)/AMP-acid ligase II